MRFSAVAVLTLVAACQAAPPEAPALDRQAIADEVQQTVNAWMETGPTNDLDAAAAFFMDDLSTYFVGDPMLFFNRLRVYPTKPDFVQAFEPSMANRTGTHYNQTGSSFVVLSADAVVHTYQGTYNITNLEGVTGPDYPMTVTVVWVRHEGAWKILHLHQSWSTDIE